MSLLLTVAENCNQAKDKPINIHLDNDGVMTISSGPTCADEHECYCVVCKEIVDASQADLIQIPKQYLDTKDIELGNREHFRYYYIRWIYVGKVCMWKIGKDLKHVFVGSNSSAEERWAPRRTPISGSHRPVFRMKVSQNGSLVGGKNCTKKI